MIITLPWLKKHLNTKASQTEIIDKLTNIGLEVEGIKENKGELGKFKIAKILKVEKHPNADKLKICDVSVGEKEILKVVCGAPNARDGLVTIYAPPGAVIPKTKFQLKVAKIRGVESKGMLCSESELNISNESSGIIELKDNESLETTHFSVADKYGNVVSSTYTLNSTFGSGVTIKGTGILMNNEMDDFSAAPGIPNQFGLLGAKANEIQPFKRPLSSMSPTIVMRDNQLFFTTGSPGGSRIITAVLQSILNIIDFDMNLEEANKSKRIHHQWQPDILQIEFSLNDATREKLRGLNYNVEVIDPATCIQTIMYKNNMYYGYGDFRRPDAFASGDIYD